MTALLRFRLLVDRLARLSTLVGAYVLLAAAMVVCADVILRKINMSPFIGTDEISGYGLALVVSWGAAHALFRGSHIRVDVLYRTLPLRARAWLDVLAAASLLALGVLLAWRGFTIFLDSWNHGTAANTPLRTPLWIPQLMWAGGLSFLALSALVALVEALLRVILNDLQGALAVMNSEGGGEDHIL